MTKLHAIWGKDGARALKTACGREVSPTRSMDYADLGLAGNTWHMVTCRNCLGVVRHQPKWASAGYHFNTVPPKDPHEIAGRWRKVARMLAVLYVEAASPTELSMITEQIGPKADWWRLLGIVAEARDPSEATVEALREVVREAVEKRKP